MLEYHAFGAATQVLDPHADALFLEQIAEDDVSLNFVAVQRCLGVDGDVDSRDSRALSLGCVVAWCNLWSLPRLEV